VLVAEISNLKSRLEAATRESSLYVKRAEVAEAKLKYAEQRIQETERTLHELAGKATIDTMTANRKIADLEARLAPLDANLAALNQSLAAVTTGVSFELEQAEKTVSRLKAILASHDAPRTR
jgi:chromosome segregation ATPase